MSEQSGKPKDVRLVQYLEALASIRSKTVRDINAYEHVLWLGRVPEEPECFSRHLKCLLTTMQTCGLRYESHKSRYFQRFPRNV